MVLSDGAGDTGVTDDQRQIHFFCATGTDAVWVGEMLDIHADSIPNLMPPAPVGAGTASASAS